MTARDAGELILGAIEARRNEARSALPSARCHWANRFAPRFVTTRVDVREELYPGENKRGPRIGGRTLGEGTNKA